MAELTTQQAYELAVQHHVAGQLVEAEGLYRKILQSEPNHADATHMLGGVAFACGRAPEAVQLIRRAIGINPHAPEYHGNLGMILASSGQLEPAVDELRQAIALRPDYVEAHYNLGKLLTVQGRLAEAIGEYQQAAAAGPDFAEAHNNLGDLLRREGRLADAEAALRVALTKRPEFPEALFNLGLVLEDQGRTDEAFGAFSELLRLQPKHAEAHNEMGNILRERNQPREALAEYIRAIHLRPGYPEARWHGSLCLLSLGEFQAGWVAFEARRELKDIWQEPQFPQPSWNGSELAGARILLWSEQGLGDTIQFARFAPLVTARGGKVIVRCQPPLKRFLAGQPGLGQVVGSDEPLPAFDVQAPLLSLPRIFGTTPDTIPAHDGPYLAADAKLVDIWAPRVPREPGRLNVGLVWATNPQPASALKRWIDPAALNQLSGIPNARFYSLQKGELQNRRRPTELKLIDYTNDLRDFADTAALISNLDVVVSCDTAVAHLAAAMGKPTYIALPFASPWRWMHERSDSPWYPSVRLYRQTAPGEWNAPIGKIAAELASIEPADR